MDLGLRYTATSSGGDPAADIPNLGVVFRYRFSDNWLVGGAIDKVEFDFEDPASFLGLVQDPAVPTRDSKIKGQLVSGWVEREIGEPSRKFKWYWSGGAGIASTRATDASGPLTSGGTFQIETETGPEIVASTGLGIRWDLGKHWRIDVTARVDHHLIDWTVTDGVSGATTTVDDFTAAGGSFLFSYRF